MALIDPPRYVSVPPALIYGCEDLEREHYKALLMIVGWLWVTKRHGGDLTTTTTELMDRWGVAERTVYHRLQRFAELGYVALRVQGRRCYLRMGPRALGEDFRASSLHGGDSRASSLHEIGAGDINISSSSGIDPDDLDPGITTTTINEDVRKVLELRGVHPRRAEALAGDVWVTEERVEAWWADLIRQERENPGRVRSLSAVLAANLEEHYEAPGLRKIDKLRRR